METQRLRRRRSRRRARKKQVAFLIVVALGIGLFVWTRILVERRKDATLFVAESSEPAPAPGERKPSVPSTATRNLILFVGDGYGSVPMTAARIMAAGEDGQQAVDAFPETALVRTSSRNAMAADAAAAMTAYMTGVKVDNEVLSSSADTRPYDEAGRPSAAHGETTCPTAGNGTPATTLLELARASGRAIGVVTTARVTQPVAAASYGHLCQKDGENALAAQLVPGGHDANPQLGDGVDVLFGGGWQHFLPKDDPRGSARNDTRDLTAEMRAKGYTVITRQSELAATKQPVGRILGLFAKAQMGFDAERSGNGEPSLADLTTRAIELLSRNANGYVLVVEGGRIGEALEASSLRRALGDANAFDQAIGAALAKVRELDPDLRNTMLVATADHDQTLVMNGDSILTGRTGEGHAGVLGIVRGTVEPTQFVPDASGRPYTILVSATGEHRIRGSRAQAPAVSDLSATERGYRHEVAIGVANALGAADVPLSAIGSNAQRFHGTIDNVQVYGLLRAALGL